MDEAAELRSKNQVDEDDRQQKRVVDVPEALRHVLALPGVGNLEARRYVQAGSGLLYVVRDVTQRPPGSIGRDPDLAYQIHVPDLRRTRSALETRHLIHGYEDVVTRRVLLAAQYIDGVDG